MDSPKQTDTAPHLVHREQFERILADYHMGERAKRVLDQATLVLLNGPSASGRNTVINRLVEMGGYRFLVSDTTRPRRSNDGVMEQNGREYWFRTEEEVLEDLRRGEFLEAEIIHKQQVSGISIRELEKAVAEHKIAIDEVEFGGIQNVLAAKPDTFAVLLLPPSFDEWQRRMHARTTMTSTELKHRLETAAEVFKLAIAADYLTLVINEAVEQSAQAIDHLVHTGALDGPAQDHARTLAKQLLGRTQALLQTM